MFYLQILRTLFLPRINKAIIILLLLDKVYQICIFSLSCVSAMVFKKPKKLTLRESDGIIKVDLEKSFFKHAAGISTSKWVVGRNATHRLISFLRKENMSDSRTS